MLTISESDKKNDIKIKNTGGNTWYKKLPGKKVIQGL